MVMLLYKDRTDGTLLVVVGHKDKGHTLDSVIFVIESGYYSCDTVWQLLTAPDSSPTHHPPSDWVLYSSTQHLPPILPITLN